MALAVRCFAAAAPSIDTFSRQSGLREIKNCSDATARHLQRLAAKSEQATGKGA